MNARPPSGRADWNYLQHVRQPQQPIRVNDRVCLSRLSKSLVFHVVDAKTTMEQGQTTALESVYTERILRGVYKFAVSVIEQA